MVSGEDADPVVAHAPREMAVELMTFRLRGFNADAKGGVGEALFDNADELDDLFTQSWQTLQMQSRSDKHLDCKKPQCYGKCVANI